MTSMITKAACPFSLDDLTVKDSDFGKVGQFSGYASTFGNRDRDDDVIDKGAFGVIENPREVKLLWQHDQAQPCGVWRRIAEDAHGLAVVGELNLEVQKGREAYALMKQGALGDMSIGFKIDGKNGAYQKDVDEDGVKRRVRHIKKIKLWEISVVSIPANPMARVGQVKSDGSSSIADALSFAEFVEMVTKAGSIREFEAALRDAEWSRKQCLEFVATHKSLLNRAFLLRDAEEGEDDVTRDADALKAAAEAERKAAEETAKAEALVAEQKAANAQLIKGLSDLFGSAILDLKKA